MNMTSFDLVCLIPYSEENIQFKDENKYLRLEGLVLWKMSPIQKLNLFWRKHVFSVFLYFGKVACWTCFLNWLFLLLVLFSTDLQETAGLSF